MTNRYPIYLMLALLSWMAAACNSDDEVVTETTYGNVAVTSFKLKANSNVLQYMDSVFFSIDLARGEIFNADSLPVGTDVSRLVVSVGTSTVSGSDITYRIRGTQRDTTVSLLRSPKDSINFADGPAKLVITSQDQLNSRTYTVRVNVHKMKPDSLAWDRMALRTLPSSLTEPTRQKTVSLPDMTLCMSADADADAACVATCSDPYTQPWQTARATLPEGADLDQLTALGADLYILAQGQLYVSRDMAATWQPTGTRMDHIYGAADILLGARRDPDGWKHVTYPATTEAPVPHGCPVAQTSQMLTTRNKWQSAPLSLVTGGVDASGTLCGDTWAHDGEKWAKISANGIIPSRGVTLISYQDFSVDEITWWVSTNPVLIALGGVKDDGELRRSVWLSHDNGIHWVRAVDLMQLPDYVPSFANAQAVVTPTTLGVARSADQQWTPMPATRVPAWYAPSRPRSRAVRPVTQWECPFIYLYGGTDAQGRLNPTLWRAVINRLLFPPLY